MSILFLKLFGAASIVIECFALAPLQGISLVRVAGRKIVNLGKEMTNPQGNTLIIFGTYAADFNAIEYGQRLRYYMPQLNEMYRSHS